MRRSTSGALAQPATPPSLLSCIASCAQDTYLTYKSHHSFWPTGCCTPTLVIAVFFELPYSHAPKKGEWMAAAD